MGDRITQLLGRRPFSRWAVPVLFSLLGFLPLPASAGVFNIPDYVATGEFSLGLEPVLNLTDGTGVAFNLKYTHGLSDLINGQIGIGTGTGPRRFRVGGAMVFDFFPDIEGQPGIGLAAQGYWVQLKQELGSQLELTGIPYIHKSFMSGETRFAPFLAFPIGASFNSGVYKTLMHVTLGSSFQLSEHFSWVAEIGVAVANTNTYVSGGFVYTH